MTDYIKLVSHNGKKDPCAILLMLSLSNTEGAIEVTDIVDEGAIPLDTADRDAHTIQILTNTGHIEVHEVAQICINVTERKAWVAKMGKMKTKVVEPVTEV